MYVRKIKKDPQISSILWHCKKMHKSGTRVSNLTDLQLEKLFNGKEIASNKLSQSNDSCFDVINQFVKVMILQIVNIMAKTNLSHLIGQTLKKFSLIQLNTSHLELGRFII